MRAPCLGKAWEEISKIKQEL